MSPDFADVLDGVVQLLPFRLDFERGPWICGGALVRAARGESLAGADVDIMFRNETDVRACRSVMAQLGWTQLPASALVNTSGSNAGRQPGDPPATVDFLPPTMWHHPNTPWSINLATGALVSSMSELIRGFDLRCCALASDGEAVVALRETFADLEQGRLFVRRPTRTARIEKYIARGFRPVQFVTKQDALAGGYADDFTPWLDLISPNKVQRWFT